MDLLILIGKCLIIGVIWAALLMPVIFKKGGALKYIISVILIAVCCYFLSATYSGIINKMTIIAIVSLVIAWITSMAIFDKDSKVKSKIIAFSCVISGISYLVVTLFAGNLHIL